jgi:hypothetical protein
MNNYRYCSLPFDWIKSKSINSIINILKDNFSSFLNLDYLEIKEIPNNTHNYLEAETTILIKSTDIAKTGSISSDQTTYSKYKIKNSKYNIMMPHEIKESFNNEKEDIVNRYRRRIERFNNLDNDYKYLDFIICGSKISKSSLDELNKILVDKFSKSKVRLIYIDSSLIESSDWSRKEFEWSELFNYLKSSYE